MRVFLDTVVWIRGLMNPRGEAGRVLDAVARTHIVVLSPETALELLTTVGRPELRTRLHRIEPSPAHVRVLAIIAAAEIVEPGAVPRVCRDANDDKFFAAAMAGRAEYIVSEDKDVLAIGEYEGVRTATVAQFVGILDGR